MKEVKMPLSMITVNTRCNSILFTLDEIQKFWIDKINPMLEEGKPKSDIESAFFYMMGGLSEAIDSARPLHLPEIILDGIDVAIPEDKIINYSPEKLQNKIDIVKREMDECSRGQRDSSVRSKKRG